MSISYYNGEFSEYEKVRIPLSDRVVFFGDGIYDAAIGRGGKIYLEEAHINRFFDNAKRLNIPLNITKSELSNILKSTISVNNMEQYFVYFQLTRAFEMRTHAYSDTQKSNLLVTVTNHEFPDIRTPMKLITRNDDRYFLCDIKTLNLLPAVMASRAAWEAGCDEAVFIRDGKVTECAHSNISIVKDGVIYTHPKSNLILPGITRERMLFICRRDGIPYVERPFERDELFMADEVILSSTTKLVSPVSHIDGIAIGKGENKLTKTLLSALRDEFFSEKN